MKIDVFLCYRRHSAQTAKLFKKYLARHGFNGEIWYSDSEAYGNYNADIDSLINSAECAIIFIDPSFTFNFLGDDDPLECITSKEIVAIIKKKLENDSFRIVTVYVDRDTALSEKESEIISTLLRRENVDEPTQSIKLISQSNANFFSTARDDEDELFTTISNKMLPNEFYASRVPFGDFCFGRIKTNADIIIWDSAKNIKTNNIVFENTPIELPLYKKIERHKCKIEYEEQNNTMISLIGADVTLSDETEEKKIAVRYQKIPYRLFSKTLEMWDQFELDRELAKFDWRSDHYKIPNAMGLAFMVITSDDQLVVTRRSEKRRVRPGEYDCSIVEGLRMEGESSDGEKYDIDDENYLDYEIRRAFREEICAVEDGLDISVFGLVFDKCYGQWNIVGTIKTPLSSSDIIHLHSVRDDTYEDNMPEFVPFVDGNGARSLLGVQELLKKYLNNKVWSMAFTAIYAALIRVGFTDSQIVDMTKDFEETRGMY